MNGHPLAFMVAQAEIPNPTWDNFFPTATGMDELAVILAVLFGVTVLAGVVCFRLGRRRRRPPQR